MRFKSLEMSNFMRYKGNNRIEFSCDDKKNVTIILGDNTVGKTTIAQAFRWCLYGALLTERGKKQEDYQLLNNDILAKMDANSRASVFVEIIAEDDRHVYQIRREVQYTRLYPKMIAKEFYKKVALYQSEKDDPDIKLEIQGDSEINELINELFPRNLSHYFLFDGERWSDATVDGVKENIKDSVHILTGLSAYQAAMKHLKDMGGNSVIRKFNDKIKGSGNIYDNLAEDRKQMERKIEKCEESVETAKINITHYETKCQEIENYLEENKNTEILQNKYKQCQVVRRTQEERKNSEYRALVQRFSEKAFMIFAEPMIEASLKMVKSVAGERRDIPHMHQASIDHIIKSGRCICGHSILPDSTEYQNLMEQRNYLPPADIGSLLGEFEHIGRNWKNTTSDTFDDMRESAQRVDDCLRAYEETCNQLSSIETQMNEQIDFKEKKNQLQHYRNEMKRHCNEKGELEGRIESYRKRIATIETDMRKQEAQSEENKKWRMRVEMAEQVYARMKKDFKEREREIFTELNQQIQNNFERMFNAKDKKIQLTEQYNIQMLYKTEIGGYREEKNLSEGEKIARNFAFIVTIMEYSRKKKAQKLMSDEIENDTLPIVLDGPFSKLGDENIRLIAKVLPEVSEQVIIFMLRKDWAYTGLDEYVGASYSIDKDADKSYASIRRTGGIS